MADPTNRYPLATANGDAIPHDVMKPQGLYVLNLSTSATSVLTLATTVKLLVLYSTVDCVLRFTAGFSANIPSSGGFTADEMFLPKGTVMTVAVPTNYISGIAISGSGVLYMTIATPWAGLGLEYQYSRR